MLLTKLPISTYNATYDQSIALLLIVIRISLGRLLLINELNNHLQYESIGKKCINDTLKYIYIHARKRKNM